MFLGRTTLGMEILGTTEITNTMYFTAWGIAVFTLPFGLLVRLIPIKKWEWTKKINIEDFREDDAFGVAFSRYTDMVKNMNDSLVDENAKRGSGGDIEMTADMDLDLPDKDEDDHFLGQFNYDMD